MLAMHSATLSYAGAVAPVAMRVSAPMMESKAELEALAKKLNPIVGYWDPMNLVDYDQFSAGQEASIGFLRQAEIKHGRVAMAAFVGYIVQSNGIHFPWALTTSGVTYADISAAGSPPDQWDALPTASKVQILCFIGILEICSESKYILEQDGKAHYMSGGKPGAFPSIKKVMPHPVPFGTRPHHYPCALLQPPLRASLTATTPAKRRPREGPKMEAAAVARLGEMVTAFTSQQSSRIEQAAVDGAAHRGEKTGRQQRSNLPSPQPVQQPPSQDRRREDVSPSHRRRGALSSCSALALAAFPHHLG